MAKARSREIRPAPLGAGLHAGRVQCVLASRHVTPRYRVELATGRVITASLDEAVSPALAEECLRQRRTVVLVDGARGPVIAGALQTSPGVAADAHGTLVLDARQVRVRADRSLVLEVPGASLELGRGGEVRFEGDKLVLDMAALVRILSGKVEIP